MAEEAGMRVKILDIRDVPSLDPDRFGKLDVLVTYQLDPTHIYIVRIPKEEFSEERLREVIKRDIEEKKRFVGREITL